MFHQPLRGAVEGDQANLDLSVEMPIRLQGGNEAPLDEGAGLTDGSPRH